MKRNQSIRVIDHVTRLMNSINGNPTYLVYFTDGSQARTKSDAACAYDIANLTHSREKGREILITWTRAGRIEAIQNPDGSFLKF